MIAPDDLFATVVPGGYCIGCGNCAFASGGSVSVALDQDGFVQARREDATADASALSTVCPFSNAVPDETALAHAQPWSALPADVAVGHYDGLFAGHVADEDFRLGGGSGGMTTWFLRALMQAGEIDHVIHVKPVDPAADPEGRLFRYAVSSDVDGLMEGRKSRYYPVDMAEAYRLITAQPGRYAVVAVPCFAKAIRLMQRQDPVVAERVRFVVGLICGHLKSRSFGEYLGWLQGIRPTELKAIDFRVKLPGGDASRYTVEASDGEETRRGVALKEYFGTTWDLGFMKYGACEYCDDVFAETADVVFGDAWIEPFQRSWMGANVVLTRHPTVSRLIEDGRRDGALALEPITLDAMIRSQAGGLRHRREGLAHRLRLTDAAGRWRPRKRFEHAAPPTAQRQRIYELRMEIARRSARAFAASRRAPVLAIFHGRISPVVARYYMVAGGVRQAVMQSVPAKWMKRLLKRG